MNGLTIAKGLASVTGVAGTAIMIIRSVGGRRGLRNPWVWGSLTAGVCGTAVLIGLAITLHQAHGDLADDVGIVGAAVLLSSWGWAWIAGMRRVATVGRLLGLGRIEPLAGGQEDVMSFEIDGALSHDDLLELLALITPTRGAPGFDWLTPAWVREQLARSQFAAPAAGPAVERGA